MRGGIILQITISKWTKHNRNDVKNPRWFACSNNITEDDDLYRLSGDEFRAWIHCLCVASKKQSATITLDVEAIERKTGIKKEHFKNALKKLIELQMVTEHVTSTLRERNAHVTSTCRYSTRQDKTEHKNNQSTAACASEVFDLQKLYEGYPRKLGRAVGLSRLKAMIKTRDDYLAFEQAVKNYVEHIRRSKMEPQFIKHFSSFVGTAKIQPWRDYLDADAGKTVITSQAKKQKTLEDLENEFKAHPSSDS